MSISFPKESRMRAAKYASATFMLAETARIQKETPRIASQALSTIQRARNGRRTIPQPHLCSQKGRRMMDTSKRAGKEIHMCTAVRFSNEEGSVFLGRNLDWSCGYGENVRIMPCGFMIPGRLTNRPRRNMPSSACASNSELPPVLRLRKRRGTCRGRSESSGMR